LSVFEQDFQGAFSGGVGKGLFEVGEGIAGFDEGLDVHHAVAKKRQRQADVSAARTKHRDLVHHDLGQIDCRRGMGGRLGRHRPLGPGQVQGVVYAVRGSRRLHHDVEKPEFGQKLFFQVGRLVDLSHGDAVFFGDGQLLGVLARENEVRAEMAQAAGAQKPQLAVAKDEHFHVRPQVHLLADLKGGRQGFGEDRLFVGNAVGDAAQVGDRGKEIFGEGAVPVEDAENPAAGTVAGVAAVEGGPGLDSPIDVATDPRANEFRRVRRFFHPACEFVPGNPGKAHVALEKLQIRVADAGGENLHKRLARSGRWNGGLGQGYGMVVESRCFHDVSVLSGVAICRDYVKYAGLSTKPAVAISFRSKYNAAPKGTGGSKKGAVLENTEREHVHKAIFQSDGGEGKGPRLDVFWFERLQDRGISRGKIQEWIKAGRAEVDGAVCVKPSFRLAGGEALTLYPEAAAEGPAPEEGGLSVVYEDDDVVVVNKPVGLVVHLAPSCPEGSLVNRLVRRYPQIAPMDDQRPGIVHRIDKDTSGLLVAALNEAAKNTLSSDFAERNVKKTYLALAHGCPERDQGMILSPIGRDPKHKTRMAVVAKGGRNAQTEYRVRWRAPDDKACLLEIDIATGRTHQIRVHMASIGHPLWGDATYGPHHAAAVKRSGGPLAKLAGRQMLHAWKLAFSHPASGELLDFTLPPPKDFWRLALCLSRRTRRVVVTGAPGSGKSAFCRYVEEAGFPVFSADAAVGELYEPGADGHSFIRSRYGDRFLDQNGRIDRKALFAAMAESEGFRRELMDLIHPLVEARMQAFFAEHADARAAFAEIPLLFERGWHDREYFDAVIGVRAEPSERGRRLKGDRGWSAQTAAIMESWHWPQDKKLEQCGFVAENGSDLRALKAEAKRILALLRDIRRDEVRAFLAWLRENAYAGAAFERGE